MSKVQWENDLVERPFCEQLKAMGWQWIEGDKDVADSARQKAGDGPPPARRDYFLPRLL